MTDLFHRSLCCRPFAGPFDSAALLLDGSRPMKGQLRRLHRYLAGLSAGRIMLWCYLIWYLVVLVRYFEASPRLWLTSLGLSAIIGAALYISVAASPGYRGGMGFWAIVRLFMMPFCVSSFAALVKDHGFILVFSPRAFDLILGASLCGAFCVLVGFLKRRSPADSIPRASADELPTN